MHNLWLVAKREYLEQVRGRAFRMTTILLPVLFGVILSVTIFANRASGGNKHLVIAAPTASLADSIRTEYLSDKDVKATLDVLAPATEEQRARLVGQVASKAIDGFLWIEAPVNGAPKATYESQSSGDFITSARLQGALNHALIRERLIQRKIPNADLDAVLDRVEVDTLKIDRDGKAAKSNGFTSFFKGYIMGFLLAMTTMIYGLNVARSIIQEKTSRIFEVVLSTAKAGDLLAGKLIGVGAVGLTQLGIWAVLGIGAVAFGLAGPLMTGELQIHFSAAELILFPVYFLLGYLLYSSLFAGLAATCETEQELQMYTPMAAVPIWLSFSLISLIVSDSNSAISVVASCFPPCAPIVMMLRMSSQTPPWWQFAISISLMVVTIVGVLWFSSKLYRVGILMYGKRATLPEILRWLRYS